MKHSTEWLIALVVVIVMVGAALAAVVGTDWSKLSDNQPTHQVAP